MQRNSHDTEEHGKVANPFRWTLPKPNHPWDTWVPGQATVRFRICCVVENINDSRATHARGIIDASFFEAVMLAQLLGASFGQDGHVVFRTEVQTTRRSRLDARRFQANRNPVCT